MSVIRRRGYRGIAWELCEECPVLYTKDEGGLLFRRRKDQARSLLASQMSQSPVRHKIKRLPFIGSKLPGCRPPSSLLCVSMMEGIIKQVVQLRDVGRGWCWFSCVWGDTEYAVLSLFPPLLAAYWWLAAVLGCVMGAEARQVGSQGVGPRSEMDGGKGAKRS